MKFQSEKNKSGLNVDNILDDIKEEVRRRDPAVYLNARYPAFFENFERRETAVWIKLRKANMRLKNGRFYLFLLPFVNMLRYLLQKNRYKSGFSVSDLILLSDEDFLKACYFKILGRKPDEEGLKCHLAVLRCGKNDKIGVINSFINSKEARRRGAVIDGLFLYNARRAFVRIPVLGYFISLAFSMLLLPKRLKEISSSIDRISANIDGISREQLYLRNKLKAIEERQSDKR
ncbi:MAG: DUF4214 domain-containing protein [Candidatus Margulisiibacteriota bacterium]